MLFLLSFLSFLIFDPFGFPTSLETLALGLSLRFGVAPSRTLPSSVLDRAVSCLFSAALIDPAIEGIDGMLTDGIFVAEPCLRAVIEIRRASRWMPGVDSVLLLFPSASGSGVLVRSGVCASWNVTPGPRSATEPSRWELISGDVGKARGAGLLVELGNATGAAVLSAESDGNATGAEASALGNATGADAETRTSSAFVAWGSAGSSLSLDAGKATGALKTSAMASLGAALASLSANGSWATSSVPSCGVPAASSRVSVGPSCGAISTSKPVTTADLRCADPPSLLETWSAHISANTPPCASSSAWVPCSTMRPSFRTKILNKKVSLENRGQMTEQGRSHTNPPWR